MSKEIKNSKLNITDTERLDFIFEFLRIGGAGDGLFLIDGESLNDSFAGINKDDCLCSTDKLQLMRDIIDYALREQEIEKGGNMAIKTIPFGHSQSEIEKSITLIEHYAIDTSGNGFKYTCYTSDDKMEHLQEYYSYAKDAVFFEREVEISKQGIIKGSFLIIDD